MEHLVPVQVTTNLGSIEDNLDAVEASIREKTDSYKAIVVTESSIADGKRFLADIRKEKGNLDQQRKDIKKAWMKPYEEFERRAKEIIRLYDEPIKAINSQLDEYEERRKLEKREEIQGIYDLVKAGFTEGIPEEWLPLEAIYNDRWENKSFKDKEIREEMERCFDQMKLSIATVKQMRSPYEAQGLLALKDTRSLQEAIAAIQQQEERQRELEAYHQWKKELEEHVKEETADGGSPGAGDPASGRPEEAEGGALAGPPADGGPGGSGEPGSGAEGMEDDLPFAPARRYTLTAFVDENELEDVKIFFDSIGIDYEVK